MSVSRFSQASALPMIHGATSQFMPTLETDPDPHSSLQKSILKFLILDYVNNCVHHDKKSDCCKGSARAIQLC